jgi:predicted ABC-class ATPase
VHVHGAHFNRDLPGGRGLRCAHQTYASGSTHREFGCLRCGPRPLKRL